jgi:hypothetical protein
VAEERHKIVYEIEVRGYEKAAELWERIAGDDAEYITVIIRRGKDGVDDGYHH